MFIPPIQTPPDVSKTLEVYSFGFPLIFLQSKRALNCDSSLFILINYSKFAIYKINLPTPGLMRNSDFQSLPLTKRSRSSTMQGLPEAELLAQKVDSRSAVALAMIA